ncbi:Hypothetical_protein [Hexamita inflata]|uniref:Hypothetical_protein n=1 Tax=Hexamita inflata TaxID=28002 RepID=A0AA86V6F2_9EUKA|nr:Hypothetical protein HINF_LOCUS65866 [Hexamita inflata]
MAKYAEENDLYYQPNIENGVLISFGIANKKHIELFNQCPNCIIADFTFSKLQNINYQILNFCSLLDSKMVFLIASYVFCNVEEHSGESKLKTDESLVFLRNCKVNMKAVRVFASDGANCFRNEEFLKQFSQHTQNIQCSYHSLWSYDSLQPIFQQMTRQSAQFLVNFSNA